MTNLLPTLAPGATAPVSLSVDIKSSDPPGDFMAIIEVFMGIDNVLIGQQASGVLGTINPTSSISITGTFGA